jgi:acyl dehydratase
MIFFEDMTPGEGQIGPSVTVDRDELVGFARDWDPMPFHVDEAAGVAAFGSLTAPGLYVLALKQRLIHALPEPHAGIASLGYDEVRFLAPVRPGDSLTLKVQWISRRPSDSKPDSWSRQRALLAGQPGRHNGHEPPGHGSRPKKALSTKNAGVSWQQGLYFAFGSP